MQALLAGLAWIGRYGTQGFAASIFLGLALPQFAAAARPLLAVSIFVFVMITFARVDVAALRGLLRRPAPPIMSAPAVAMLLNLQPTLIMAAVLVTTTLSPLVSPVLAEFIVGAAVP